MGGEKNVVVGVLGQWASGKTTAAKTMVDHLGGPEEVIFLTDRKLLGAQVTDYIRQLPEMDLTRTVDDVGCQKLAGPLMSVRLQPGETLDNVDLNHLDFRLTDDIYDNVPAGECNLLEKVRHELGRQIQARLPEGKPIVIEAGFGTNLEPRGENPFCHTLADFFRCLDHTGLAPDVARWIVIEASYVLRSMRNYLRYDSVPAKEFDRLGAHGGDLTRDQQRALEEQGVIITRVCNQHSDVGRFQADIIAAYQELFVLA
jgi:hypothetical protein